jgi:transposase
VKKFSKPTKQRWAEQDLQAKVARLKRKLKWVEQERNILKEAAVFFAGESKNATNS